MSTILQQLFDKYEVQAKDRYEISQIFALLPEYKKQNILENFWHLAVRIKKIQEDIMVEQEILIWSAVDNIKKAISNARNTN